MRELGYIEGQNLLVEARFADSKAESLPGLATELLRLKVDVIVATASPTYRVLQRMNPTVPIVVTVTADPVLEGLAASVARPGGNFTGLSDTAADLGPKQIELLKSVLPKDIPGRGAVESDQCVTSGASNAADVGRSEPRSSGRAGRGRYSCGHRAWLRLAGPGAPRRPPVRRYVLRPAIATDRTGRAKAPDAVDFHSSGYAEAGGLMSYGAPLVDNFQRATTYVDKILKGANPGELPFEQPRK